MKIVKNLVAAYSLKAEFAARRNKLYRIAYSWCHEQALADDLVQETIYKALKNASKLRDVNTLDSWLYRILYNCWHDYLRVKGRNVELVDEEQVDQSENYQQSQIVKRVRASVEQLPLALREVVTLADFAGFSYAQIAEITEVPIGTVMSRLFRARKNLKEQLLEFGSDELSEFKLRRIK